MPTSPLDLVLGLDGSETRVFDLASWGVGLDWATATVGDEELPTGAVISGEEVLELASGALDRLGQDLRSLEEATRTVLGIDLLEEQSAITAVHHLDRLCEDVAVIAVWAPDAGRFLDGHRSDALLALAAVETLRIAGRGGRAVECGYCGRLFVPQERADELYCRRSVPGGASGDRTCRQVGPQHRYAESVDAPTSAYRRHYKRLDNRVRRGQLERWRVDEWRVQAKALLDRAHRRGWSIKKLEEALDDLDPGAQEE